MKIYTERNPFMILLRIGTCVDKDESELQKILSNILTSECKKLNFVFNVLTVTFDGLPEYLKFILDDRWILFCKRWENNV